MSETEKGDFSLKVAFGLVAAAGLAITHTVASITSNLIPFYTDSFAAAVLGYLVVGAVGFAGTAYVTTKGSNFMKLKW